MIGVRGSAQAMVEAARERPACNAVFRRSGGGRASSCAAIARPGDAVLFKGSRGVRVERALERFLA